MIDFISLDTETQDGKPILVCVDDGKRAKDYFINTQKDVINLFHDIHTGKISVGFCFNLEYDGSGLLKYFGYDAIMSLFLNKSLRFENIFIRYLSGKCLMLTKYYFKKKELPFEDLIKFLKEAKIPVDKNDSPDKLIYLIDKYNKKAARKEKLTKRVFYFFDIWQFYQMSLDKASATYLNKRKNKLPLKWMDKLKKYFNDPRYREKIIRYCRKDTRLTWLLSYKFIKMLDDCDIHPKRFYSAAYIAKNFIKSQIKVPVVDDPDIIKFMVPAFRGGRTEVMKRGFFKKAILSDMRSAYPFALSLLKRIYHAELSKKIDKSSDYFFADCEIELPKKYILPVPVFFNMWKYPYGKMRGLVDNMTYDNIIRAGGKITHIHKVLNVYCDNEYPFRAIVKKMFAQRKKSESHKYIFKMLLNAYIGKLHERKFFVRMLDEEEEPKVLGNIQQFDRMQEDFETIIKNSGCDCYYLGKVNPKCRNQMCVEFRKEYKGVKEPPTINYQGGNIFATEKTLANGTNIIYAALVTSIIRNIIYQRGLELGGDLICFLTDGILSTRPLKRYGKRLGDFEKKHEGWLYILGSGMYQTAQGTKFRGFNSDKNLLEISKKYKTKDVMEIPILERTGLGRAVRSERNFEDFNILKPTTKELKVNFDRNRTWTAPFKNFGQALNTNIESLPIKI